MLNYLIKITDNRNFKQSDLTNNCVDCKFGKKCRGGCMSVSLGITGKSNGDPYCLNLIENSFSEV